MRKLNIVIIFIIILLCAVLVLRFSLGGTGGTWVVNENGLYDKSENSSGISEEVVDQQLLILAAMQLYFEKQREGMNFSSQCLGVVGDYAVDVVHIPRIAEDDVKENQCEEFISGMVKKLIELDAEGNVMRII